MQKQGAEKDSRLWLTPVTILYWPRNLNLPSLKSSKGQVKINYEKTSVQKEVTHWSSKSFFLFKFIYVDLCSLCPLVDCCIWWSLCMTITCILGPKLSSMMETLNITKRSSFTSTGRRAVFTSTFTDSIVDIFTKDDRPKTLVAQLQILSIEPTTGAYGGC